jgi:hypothetical protein
MSANQPRTSEETFQEDTTTGSRPKSSPPPANSSEETFQEGTTPVQAFSTPVVPADSGTEVRLRQGRPPRVSPATPDKPQEVVGAPQTGS